MMPLEFIGLLLLCGGRRVHTGLCRDRIEVGSRALGVKGRKKSNLSAGGTRERGNVEARGDDWLDLG